MRTGGWHGFLVPVLAAAAVLVAPVAATAQQARVSDERLRQVRANIDKERGMAEAGVREADGLTVEIDRIDARLAASASKLKVLVGEEARFEADYGTALAGLRAIDDRRLDASDTMARRMGDVYRRGRLGSHRALAEAARSSEPLRMARYLAAIWLADKEATAAYEITRDEQRRAVEELEKKKVASSANKKALEDERVRYEEARHEKELLLARAKAELGEHEVKLKRLAADEEALKRLTGARSGTPVAAVRSVWERLFAGKPEGAFSQRKGRLDPPVVGTLTRRYGERLDSSDDKGLRGLQVRGRAAAGVRSVGDGKVVFAGPFPGLGKTVIVNHGERYHSVYARLGDIVREVGHRVSGGDRLGQLGRADTTLHFELRAEGRPLDPAEWFEGGYESFIR